LKIGVYLVYPGAPLPCVATPFWTNAKQGEAKVNLQSRKSLLADCHTLQRRGRGKGVNQKERGGAR